MKFNRFFKSSLTSRHTELASKLDGVHLIYTIKIDL